VLILSSLEKYVPTGYSAQIQNYLTKAGYKVTLIKDTDVTLELLTTQLNNYDIVIWRTNIYDWAHVMYWYVGEISNRATLQAYATDFAAKRVDNTNGILGVSLDFFTYHFGPGSLSNIQLAVLISSTSSFLGQVLLRAGVKAVIDYYGSFSLTFDMIDYVTQLIIRFLSMGSTVKDSVWEVIKRFLNQKLANPLDSSYVPQIWWMGDSTLKIV